MVHPLLQKLEPLQEVSDVATKWLQAWVGALGPVVWNLGEGELVTIPYYHLYPA